MLRDLEHEKSISKIGSTTQFLSLVVQPEIISERTKHFLIINSNKTFISNSITKDKFINN